MCVCPLRDLLDSPEESPRPCKYLLFFGFSFQSSISGHKASSGCDSHF